MGSMASFLDRIQQAVSGTPGTSTTVTLGTAETGYYALADAGSGAVDGVYYPYVMYNGADREEGWGYSSSTKTVWNRAIIIRSTNAGAKVDFASGTKFFLTVGAADLPSIEDRTNELLMAALYSKALGAPQRSVGQYAIGFASTTGVNTGSSTNYEHDATNKLIKPSRPATDLFTIPALTSNLSAWTTYTLRTVFDSAGLAVTGARLVRVKFEAPSNANLTLTGASIGSAASSGDAYDFDSTPVALTFGGNAGIVIATGTQEWSDWVDVNIIAGRPLIVAWAKNADNRALRGIATATNCTQYYRALATDQMTVDAASYTNYSASAQLLGVCDIEYQGAANNMTLLTTMQTADASVSRARAVLSQNEVDSITINTDATLELSLDNGANYTSAPLIYVGVGQSGRKVYRTDDIFCTPGTQVIGRYKTLNNKMVELHALTLRFGE